MTIDDDDDGGGGDSAQASLSKGPQEWQWFLQEKEMIPKNVEFQTSAPIKSLECSPSSTAVILQQAPPANDNVKERVAQGLLWLHQACFYDLAQLETALDDLKFQQTLLEKVHKIHQGEATVVAAEMQTIMSNMDAQESQQDEDKVQRILELYSKVLQEALAHYQDVCRQTHQPPCNIAMLQQLVSEENSVEFTKETTTEIRKELEELAAFYSCRLKECSSASIPAFMTLVSSSNDAETLSKYKDALQKVLNDLNAAQRLTVNKEGLLETTRGQQRTLQEQVNKSSSRVDEMQTKIQSLQRDMQWCREQIQSVKTTVERDIATLFEYESNNTNVNIIV